MGMSDFLHKSLIKAGTNDAVNNMMIGAGVGAVANIGLGVTNGDFSILGNGTSGALLGAAGGGVARHMGAKYVDGLGSHLAETGKYENKFSTTMFTKAKGLDEKSRQDFWGSNENFGKFDRDSYMSKVDGMNQKETSKATTSSDKSTTTQSSNTSNVNSSTGSAPSQSTEELVGDSLLSKAKNKVQDWADKRTQLQDFKTPDLSGEIAARNKQVENEALKSRDQRLNDYSRLNVARNGTGSERQGTYPSSGYLQNRKANNPKLDAKNRELNNSFVRSQKPDVNSIGSMTPNNDFNLTKARSMANNIDNNLPFKRNNLSSSIMGQ